MADHSTSKRKISGVEFYLLFAFSLIIDLLELASDFLATVGAFLLFGTAGIGAAVSVGLMVVSWLSSHLLKFFPFLKGLSGFLGGLGASPWVLFLSPAIIYILALFVDGAINLFLWLKGAKVEWSLAGALIERIPVLNGFPVRTISVIIVYIVSKVEEEVPGVEKVLEGVEKVERGAAGEIAEEAA